MTLNMYYGIMYICVPDITEHKTPQESVQAGQHLWLKVRELYSGTNLEFPEYQCLPLHHYQQHKRSYINIIIKHLNPQAGTWDSSNWTRHTTIS